jgi:hypothetical protein
MMLRAPTRAATGLAREVEKVEDSAETATDWQDDGRNVLQTTSWL